MIGISQYLLDNPYVTTLLICHFLSDFQFQNQDMADKKTYQKVYLIKHIIRVALPLVLLGLYKPATAPILIIIITSHGIIDWFKQDIANFLMLDKKFSFVLDQVMHLLIILIAALVFKEGQDMGKWLNPLLLNMILFFVIITKPANVAFKIFFDKYQPLGENKMDTIAGAGATIGLLERIIMGACMIMSQFTSIGLVFTAKSIARYNKISESPSFAEYYLIGSLYSILSVFVTWMLLFN